MITALDLALELTCLFKKQMDLSFEILSNNNRAIEHLTNVGCKYGRDELKSVSENTWRMALDIFEANMEITGLHL